MDDTNTPAHRFPKKNARHVKNLYFHKFIIFEIYE